MKNIYEDDRNPITENDTSSAPSARRHRSAEEKKKKREERLESTAERRAQRAQRLTAEPEAPSAELIPVEQPAEQPPQQAFVPVNQQYFIRQTPGQPPQLFATANNPGNSAGAVYTTDNGKKNASSGMPNTAGMRIVYQSPDYDRPSVQSAPSAQNVPTRPQYSAGTDYEARMAQSGRHPASAQRAPSSFTLDRRVDEISLNAVKADRQPDTANGKGAKKKEDGSESAFVPQQKAESVTQPSAPRYRRPAPVPVAYTAAQAAEQERAAAQSAASAPVDVYSAAPVAEAVNSTEATAAESAAPAAANEAAVQSAAKPAKPAARKLTEDEKQGKAQKKPETTAQKDVPPPAKQPATKGEIIRRIVLVVAVIVMVCSAVYLAYEWKLGNDNKRLESELSNLAPSETQSTTQSPDAPPQSTEVETTLSPAERFAQLKAENPNIKYPDNLQPKYAEYYTKNQDFVGYLSIPGLDIGLPVVQGKDDSTYLNKNFYGKSTKYGCPFVSYLNNIEPLDRNTVIHGHNMKNNTIFGPLMKYKTLEGYKKAPVITFNTLYKDYQWKVIAAFITNSKAEDDNDYTFLYYYTSVGDAAYAEYFKALEVRSLYSTGVDVLPTDKLLTLSTCSYEFDDARFVVVARLVRTGESPEVDTSLAKVNPNPKYPQAYYDKKKINNPYGDAYNWTFS